MAVSTGNCPEMDRFHTRQISAPPLWIAETVVFLEALASGGKFRPWLRWISRRLIMMDHGKFQKIVFPAMRFFLFWRILAFHWIPIECKGTTVSYLFVVARWFAPKGTKCNSPAQKSILVKSWVSAFWSNFTHVKSPHPPSEFQKQSSFWNLWQSEKIPDHGCDGFLDI